MEGGTTVTFTSAVETALGNIISWCGTVIDAVLTGDLNDLLPLLAIGISISVLMLGVKCIKSFAWGT